MTPPDRGRPAPPPLNLPFSVVCGLLALSPIAVIVGWLATPLPHPWAGFTAQVPFFGLLSLLAFIPELRPDAPAARWYAHAAAACGVALAPSVLLSESKNFLHDNLFSLGDALMLCAPTAAWTLLCATVLEACRSYYPEGEPWMLPTTACTLMGITLGGGVVMFGGCLLAAANLTRDSSPALCGLCIGVPIAVPGLIAVSVMMLILALRPEAQAAWFGPPKEDE